MGFLRLWIAAVALLLLQDACLARVEISSTVRLYVKVSAYKKTCNVALTRAKAAGSTAININPAQRFLDNNGDYNVDQYCYVGGGSSCVKVTKKTTQQFKVALTYCVKRAWALGFREIQLTPHINDARGQTWRNLMKVSPFVRVKGASYYDFLIAPMIAAANAAPGAKLMFNLQGEQNGALIMFPDQWRQLASTIKRRLRHSNKLIGVNLNFNKVCPWCSEWSNYRPSGDMYFDNTKIQTLFRSLNYVATSAYQPMWYAGDSYATVDPSRMEASLNALNGELSYFGVDLKTLGKPLHYAEFGLGGATCEQNNCPAQSAADVAKYPFWGISKGYDPNNDPWKNSDNTDFRRRFYKSLIQWASKYDTNNFKVSHVFLWNHGSYDVQGVFLDSTTSSGSWRDSTIAGWIKSWNQGGSVP